MHSFPDIEEMMFLDNGSPNLHTHICIFIRQHFFLHENKYRHNFGDYIMHSCQDIDENRCFSNGGTNEGPCSCDGHQGGATTAPAPSCYAKTRLASYSIRFLASQHFNTDDSLHQCRAFILFLDVRTMRTFVYQFGIALRDE